MPINASAFDSRIALGSRPSNIGESFAAGQESKRRRELLDLAIEDRGRQTKRQEEADLVAAEDRRIAASEKAKMDNLKSVVLGAVEIKPLLDNPETLHLAIDRTRRRIEGIKARDPEANTADSEEVLEMMLSGRVDLARSAVDSTIQAGAAQGFFDSPQQARTSPTQKSTPFIVRREDGSQVVMTPTFDPNTGQTNLVESPFEGQRLSSLGETPNQRQQREIDTAGGKETSKSQAQRDQEHIDVGQRQADATAVIRRGLELLDVIDTGRPEAIVLAARNLFGIAGADETELNANLGKAILAQLRQTFGAQFTENEGKRLEGIEANFGKSTAGNRRLLEQTLRLMERDSRRGIETARRLGDGFAVREIEEALNFSLGEPPETGNTQSDEERLEALGF